MTKNNSNSEKVSNSYSFAEVKSIPKSQVEIVAAIAPEIWEKFRAEALKNINESISVDGFRKGLVPENILISKVGQTTILQEMSELAISEAYVHILIDKKIEAIGKPQVTLTKLAAGNPLEFKITTAVLPTIELPDCRNLAAKEVAKSEPKELKVENKDVDEAILKIRKSYALNNPSSMKKTETASTSKESKTVQPVKDKPTPEEEEKKLLDSLPEFNDEFVRGLGDYKDIEDFKTKVREILGQTKKDEAKEKTRIRIVDALLDATTIELPEIMIESELNRTQAQFETDIEKMGVKLDDYLKHAKKTLGEIRNDWKPHAEKKAKIQLILNAIAKKENIAPNQAEIQHEANHIIEHYKDADKDRAYVYAETVLTNEKVFEWLEGQPKK